MIKVTRTYETWTPEDVEFGDASDRGILGSHAVGFRDLVYILRADFEESSCLGMGVDVYTYFLYRETNYRTGAETSVAIHFDRDNAPRLVKYWEKAARAARLVA